MLSIEKYKDNIEKHINVCGLYREIYKIKNREYAHDCCENCDECYDRCIRWLAEEYKEPVLDDVEKEYLSAVIKPFRNHVTSVRKWFNGIDYQIIISLDHSDNLCQLPRFPLSSEMYKGMDSKKWYSLQELGL